MDFKVFLEGYNNDCYYLNLKQNDIFHFIINVNINTSKSSNNNPLQSSYNNLKMNFLKKILKGGDLKVTVNIHDPGNNQIYYQQDQTFAWYDNANITLEGLTYFCLE